jgi:hypothetical protein
MPIVPSIAVEFTGKHMLQGAHRCLWCIVDHGRQFWSGAHDVVLTGPRVLALECSRKIC